jgi:chemotaxis receptor (MCP) glutamine deamidase CheD
MWRIWSKDRFDAAGDITLEMAGRALQRGTTLEAKKRMQQTLNDERKLVRLKMKEQVHELLRMGADITKMTYLCSGSCGARACVTPKNMRDSYARDGSLLNIKCIHWIFNELPFGTHQDVLPQRKCHMDLAVEKVEQEMSISWAPTKEDDVGQRNCLQQVYCKILNDKKQTIIKEDGTDHGRKPIVRRPKTVTAAKNATHFKRGKAMYYWHSKAEGECSVSCQACVVVW